MVIRYKGVNLEKTLRERLELEIEQNKAINDISEAIKNWDSYDLEEKNKFIYGIFSGLALLLEIKLQIAIGELVKSHILEENEIKKKVNSVRNLLSLKKYKDKEDIFLESEPNKSGVELVRKGYTVKELIESDIPDEKFLIGRGIMPQNGYVLLGGATKEGKTILALQMSLDLVSGTNFLDKFPIEKKLKILYLYAARTVSWWETNKAVSNALANKKIRELEKIIDKMDGVIKKGKEAEWLNTSNGELNNDTPLEVISRDSEGVKEVLELLCGIERGIPA